LTTIRIAIPCGPSEYEQVYDEIADHYDWAELLPDIQPPREDFFWWAHKFTWFYAVWVDDKLAGYILVRGIKNGEGELHVCRLPGFSWVVPIAWRQWWGVVSDQLHTLHAYTPVSNRRLARLAESYGFEVTEHEDYFHGKLTKS